MLKWNNDTQIALIILGAIMVLGMVLLRLN